jgi:hypothetical protein
MVFAVALHRMILELYLLGEERKTICVLRKLWKKSG